MEINGVTPSNGLQAVLAALAEIAAAGEGPAGALAGGADTGVDPRGLPGAAGVSGGHASLGHVPGDGHPLEHGPKTATAESQAVHPDARPDRGAESALVQGFARPETPLPGISRHGNDQAATPALAGGEFSLPADQLVNAAVIGLQVEPAFAWPLQQRGFDPAPELVPAPRNDAPAQPVIREEVRRAADYRSDRHGGHDADDGEALDAGSDTQVDAANVPCDHHLPAADAADGWPEPLSRALREALRGRPVAPALLAAAEQWRLGRCVVLACPQGRDPAGPAWAFVLWPRPGSLVAIPLALAGLRVGARLQWSHLPPTRDWCHARAMKEQHPRKGRQLVALDAHGTATVPCEVQLGPVPLRTPRWRDACIRIDVVRPFWSALGRQWSVTVVVGSRPLAGLPPTGMKGSAWQA
jgi:hypothetical protein